MIKKIIAFICVLLYMSIIVMGCGTIKEVQKGTTGYATGLLIGNIIGKQTGSGALGTAISASVGKDAEVLMSRTKNKQTEAIEKDLSGAKVERVGEGIKLTYASGFLFNPNSSDLQASAKKSIVNLANILNKYEDTNIVIEGNTDNEGSRKENQRLSEHQARVVADYLKGLGVSKTRITIIGRGETNPIASNVTVDGRQQNRRVEIMVFAIEKTKEATEDEILK